MLAHPKILLCDEAEDLLEHRLLGRRYGTVFSQPLLTMVPRCLLVIKEFIKDLVLPRSGTELLFSSLLTTDLKFHWGICSYMAVIFMDLTNNWAWTAIFGHHIILSAECHSDPHNSLRKHCVCEMLLFLCECHKCCRFFFSPLERKWINLCPLSMLEVIEIACENWLETSQIKIENFRRSQASILPFVSAPHKPRNLEAKRCKRIEAAQNESTLESLGRNIFFFSAETSGLAQN